MSALLIVDNVPLSFRDRDLARLFADYGTVRSARIVMARTDQALGFGYVEMATVEEAEKACRALNGCVVMGMRMVVQPAGPDRPESQPGPG